MNERLNKVVRLARKAYKPSAAEPLQSAPFGFSTRVAARWATESNRTDLTDLWQRLSWWGATASLLICLSAAVYRATLPEPNAFDLLLEQPASEAYEF